MLVHRPRNYLHYKQAMDFRLFGKYHHRTQWKIYQYQLVYLDLLIRLVYPVQHTLWIIVFHDFLATKSVLLYYIDDYISIFANRSTVFTNKLFMTEWFYSETICYIHNLLSPTMIFFKDIDVKMMYCVEIEEILFLFIYILYHFN